ncbi:programmed cell death protein 2-like isoform X2 [Corticium candelabrum]|uniref:programmed cell death protein 2-like isoform X2 n=1 Tax=Corticium candelabrum TaxID=121492 RepID=UPI002E2537D1|nr:programmed cell death protein 2-like isoform X2 [Corticium candelabrum]
MTSPDASVPVQLGVVGRRVCVEKDDTGWWVSKIGGQPNYFARPPDVDLICCRRCQHGLTLIVQLYCPIEGSKNHRLLHVFACLATTCQGHSESWLVLRSEMFEFSEEKDTQEMFDEDQQKGHASDWSELADDWDNDTSENQGDADEDDLQLFEAALERRQEWRTEAHSPKVVREKCTAIDCNRELELHVPSFYIDAMQERYSCKNPTSHELELMSNYEIEHGINPQQMDVRSTSGDDTEYYEKAAPAHGDNAFQKFYKRIECCPHQCLRYIRTGSPLCISNRPEQQPPKEIPLCGSCRGTRVFEMQLMPALVHIIQRSSSLVENLEFGTVLVYTCSTSCWSPPDQTESNFRVEYAFVQSED